MIYHLHAQLKQILADSVWMQRNFQFTALPISAFAVRRASPHNLGSIAASTSCRRLNDKASCRRRDHLLGSATIAIAANLGSTATSTSAGKVE